MFGALVRRRASPGPCAAPRRIRRFVERCAALLRTPFDAYRPELHYMRGPGPKWREKQRARGRDETPASAQDAIGRGVGIRPTA